MAVASAIGKGVHMSKVVQIPPTIEALWRANFAAGDRHDDDEAELLRCLWREAMDAKRASPIETPKDAYAKLWWACYWIGLGADEDLSLVSRRLLRVGSAIRRGIFGLDHLIELRACAKDCALSDCERAEQARARIVAVIGWLARPRLVSPRASGAHRCVRAQQGYDAP
jgi:hypothetical protein